MENQKIFDLIFWIFILPVIICVKTPTVKFLIFSIGLVHAIYSAPWPDNNINARLPSYINYDFEWI